jgi:hypothetical protein
MGHDKNADKHLRSRDANAPGLLYEPPSRIRGRRECRVRAAPMASCTQPVAVHATAPGTSRMLGKRVVARAFVPSSGLPVGNIHFRRWAQMTFHNPDHVDQLHRQSSVCRYYQRPPQRRL